MSSQAIPRKRKKENSDDENEIIKDGALTSAAENFFEALCTAIITQRIIGES
jgi:hypothetical protein